MSVKKSQICPQQTTSPEEQATFTTVGTYVGFSAALAATTLFLVKTTQDPNYQILSILVVIMVIPILLLASRCNDFLITRFGTISIKLCALAGSLSQIVLVLSGFNLALAPLTALWITAFILIWSGRLVNQFHRALLLLTATAAIVTGAFLTFILDIDVIQIMVLVMVLALISTSCDLLLHQYKSFGKQFFATPRSFTRALSRQHGADSNSNNFTIIALGITMGITLVLSGNIQLEYRTTTLILGSVTIIASLATLLLRELYSKTFENTARRTLAIFVSCALLPYPFLGTQGQIICICLLLLTLTPNTIILIDAIVETARLKFISPFWLVGRQGALYFLGVLVGESGFLYCFIAQSPELLPAICVLAALVFITLQVFIENQTYPFFDDEPAEDDTNETDVSEPEQLQLSKGGGGIWSEKLNMVASRKRLSPRQIEVMRLLAKGRGIKYITDYFAISRATAKTHIYNLYRKLEVHSRQDMLDLIEQEPLDDQDD